MVICLSLQERFRKCWRNIIFLWMTLSLELLILCKFSAVCLFFVRQLCHLKILWCCFTLRFSSVCGDEFLSHAGSGSGGYLHHVFTYAAKQLFGEEVKELTYKTLRFVCLHKLYFFKLKQYELFCSSLPSGTKTSRRWDWRKTGKFCCALQQPTVFATFRTLCRNWKEENRHTIL